MEPSSPAYRAAWEFALAARGGELATLAREWAAQLPNKETLRQLTLADTPLATVGYRGDHDRISREFSRRYVSTVAAACRRHDPNHLILGCRFGALRSAPILDECASPHVDVVSINQNEPALS